MKPFRWRQNGNVQNSTRELVTLWRARNRFNTFFNSRITGHHHHVHQTWHYLTSKLCRTWPLLPSDNLLGTSILKFAVFFQFAFLLQQLTSQGLLRTLKNGQLKRSQENSRVRMVRNVLFVTLKVLMNLILCTKNYVKFWLTTLIICIVSILHRLLHGICRGQGAYFKNK